MNAAELVSAESTGLEGVDIEKEEEAEERVEVLEGGLKLWRVARWTDLAFFARSLAAWRAGEEDPGSLR